MISRAIILLFVLVLCGMPCLGKTVVVDAPITEAGAAAMSYLTEKYILLPGMVNVNSKRSCRVLHVLPVRKDLSD